MFKKILCWMLLPLCALGILAGCGKDKTAKQVQQLYVEIKSEYANSNYLFKEKDGVMGDDLYITYDGELAELERMDTSYAYTSGDFGPDERLYKRYYVLKNFQQGVLSRISEYYAKWATKFYDGIALKDAQKEDLNSLYKSLETLKEALRTFEVARNKVEADINIMTYTGAIRSNLTEYSYQFNRLIEVYSDFVNRFRDVQVKNLFADENVSETTNSEVLNRLCDEFYLNMAQAIYYKTLKSFDRTNECDLSDLVPENGDFSDLYNEYLFILNKIGEYNFAGFSGNVTGKSAEIEEFIYIRNAFMQKFTVYKKVYDAVDYYEYNGVYLNYAYQTSSIEAENIMSAYKETLSDVNKANIALIESFENTIMEEYIEKFKDLIA